jgi:hypothetical protein
MEAHGPRGDAGWEFAQSMYANPFWGKRTPQAREPAPSPRAFLQEHRRDPNKIAVVQASGGGETGWSAVSE